MGSYIDWNDVSQRYAAIPADWTAEQFANMVLDAEAEVETALALRYSVPFPSSSSCPQMVRTLCIDVAYYRAIFQARPEVADKLREYIDKRLNALACGSATLVSSGVALSDFVMASTDNSYRSAFGRDNDVNWRPSETALEDATQERIGD